MTGKPSRKKSPDAPGTQAPENHAGPAIESFQQLTENISEVFWIGSVDWQQVFYVSPAFETVWGLSLEFLYENPLA